MIKRLLVFIFACLPFLFARGQGVNTIDSLALVSFYNSTYGPEWENNTNWLQGPVNTWHGITVKNTRVTRVHLTNNSLKGNIPSEISHLTGIDTLSLYNNSLNGNIPSEIGNLHNLISLNLALNDLSGHIPPEIGNLTNLHYLGLYVNSLTGSIPPEIGNLLNIRILYLDGNLLTGSIPSEVSNLTRLYDFLLQHNFLSGDIPVEIKNMLFLTDFHIASNCFTFSHLEPISGNSIEYFQYSQQKQIALQIQEVIKNPGEDLQFDIPQLAIPEVAATKNQYQWRKDTVVLTNYSSSPEYAVTGLDSASQGYYYCVMKNDDFPQLKLYTDSIKVVLRPDNIVLSVAHVDENTPAGSAVGILITKDVNQANGHTFQLIPGNGTNNADNPLFSIDGDQLILNDAPDYETQQAYHIYVRTMNNDSLTFDKALVISVNNLNDTPPVTRGFTFTVDKNCEVGTVVGTVSATDPDGTLNELTYSLDWGNDHKIFSLDTQSGTLTINNPEPLDSNESGKFMLGLSVSDGLHSSQGFVVIIKVEDLSTGTHPLPANDWKLYPNPAQDVIYIFIDDPGKFPGLKLELINALGRIVYHEEIPEPKNSINLQGYEKGVYLLHIYNEEFSEVKRIILQ